MKRGFYFILLILAIACQKNESNPPDVPPSDSSKPFVAGQQTGNSIQYVALDPVIEFPVSLEPLGNHAYSDTLHLDLDADGSSDFILIYHEEYWNVSTKPDFQCFELFAPHGIQLPGDEGAWGDLIYRCDSGQVIDESLAWIWEEETHLCSRQGASFMGASQQPFYLVFKKQAQSNRFYGWIRFRLVWDDFFFKSLVIEAYAIKPY